MLSLQRAKPFCATAFQPPGKLSFRRFVQQSKAANRKFRPKIPMCLQSIACNKNHYPERRRRVAGYALRHRAQQYSGQKKNSFCPSFPLPRFQHHQAFFSFPPYRCLSLRFSSVFNRESHRFPMFLQHIAGQQLPSNRLCGIPDKISPNKIP